MVKNIGQKQYFLPGTNMYERIGLTLSTTVKSITHLRLVTRVIVLFKRLEHASVLFKAQQ